MTSRERVLAAVNHRTPDRVPVDLGSMKASGIAIGAYQGVRDALGLKGPARVVDPRFMIADVQEDVLRRFGCDVLPLDATMVSAALSPESDWVPRRLFSGQEALFPPGTRIEEDPDGSWVLLDADGKRTSFRMPRGGHYFDDTAFNTPGSTIDPRQFRPVAEVPAPVLRDMETMSRRLTEDTEYALLGWGYGVCFLGLSLITDRRSNVTMGLPDQWMMMLLTEKETCHEMMGRSVDATIACLQQMKEAVGDRAFAWGIASDDSGTQRGEFIRPELWAEMIKPHYARLCAWIHEHTSWKTYFHCCGSIYHLIPHLIEAGIDILNPVQTSAANMDPVRLKEEFGSRLCFWGGGCDTQRVLPTATPEEVREHVRERMAIFAPGGGYVFTQVHNVQKNVPPENIIAMFDAAREFGAMPVPPGGTSGRPRVSPSR
jgi:uroporphyrinogen-III decarboxylase